MDNWIADDTALCFGIRDSKDLYEKLQLDAIRLREDWNSFDAFNFMVTAWHLYTDWTKSDPAKSLRRLKRGKSHTPQSIALILSLCQDIANGSKHFKLTGASKRNQKVGKLHSGLEATWYSYFFHENILGVSTKDDSHYFPIRVLHNILMTYFEWVFDDSTPVTLFPEEIHRAVNYGQVSSRGAFKTEPELWRLHRH